MGALVAPSFANATTSEVPERIAVTVLRVEGKGVYVSWTPAAGAISYDVYRGDDLARLEYLGSTPAVEFADFQAPDEDLWYQIVSVVPDALPDSFGGPIRGKCLALRGATGFSVTLSNCVPNRIGV